MATRRVYIKCGGDFSARQEAFVTNDLGMHSPRSYATAPTPGVLRVAVLGSSVVYGLNLSFADTLPVMADAAGS